MVYQGKERTKYAASYKADQAQWVKAIKDAVGYANLTDFYDIKVF